MKTGYAPVLASVSADLSDYADGFDVHVGRAPSGKADPPARPYAVLATADTEAESVFSGGKVRANSPSDVLIGANVYGTLGDAVDTARAIQDRWLSRDMADVLAGGGRHLIRADLAQSLPLPSGDPDGQTYGRRVAVRFTTSPKS